MSSLTSIQLARFNRSQAMKRRRELRAFRRRILLLGAFVAFLFLVFGGLAATPFAILMVAVALLWRVQR